MPTGSIPLEHLTTWNDLSSDYISRGDSFDSFRKKTNGIAASLFGAAQTYVLKAGDTMTGGLVAPSLSSTGTISSSGLATLGSLLAGSTTLGATQVNGSITVRTGDLIRFGPVNDNTDNIYLLRENTAANSSILTLQLGDDADGQDYFRIVSGPGAGVERHTLRNDGSAYHSGALTAQSTTLASLFVSGQATFNNGLTVPTTKWLAFGASGENSDDMYFIRENHVTVGGNRSVLYLNLGDDQSTSDNLSDVFVIRAGGVDNFQLWSGNRAWFGNLPNGLQISGNTSITGSLSVSTGNATGGGIVFADDGDIVDLNDAFCSMRFTNGVRIYSANRGGTASITLNSDGSITALSGGMTITSTGITASGSMGLQFRHVDGGNIGMDGTLFLNWSRDANVYIGRSDRHSYYDNAGGRFYMNQQTDSGWGANTLVTKGYVDALKPSLPFASGYWRSTGTVSGVAESYRGCTIGINGSPYVYTGGVNSYGSKIIGTVTFNVARPNASYVVVCSGKSDAGVPAQLAAYNRTTSGFHIVAYYAADIDHIGDFNFVVIDA